MRLSLHALERQLQNMEKKLEKFTAVAHPQTVDCRLEKIDGEVLCDYEHPISEDEDGITRLCISVVPQGVFLKSAAEGGGLYTQEELAKFRVGVEAEAVAVERNIVPLRKPQAEPERWYCTEAELQLAQEEAFKIFQERREAEERTEARWREEDRAKLLAFRRRRERDRGW